MIHGFAYDHEATVELVEVLDRKTLRWRGWKPSFARALRGLTAGVPTGQGFQPDDLDLVLDDVRVLELVAMRRLPWTGAVTAAFGSVIVGIGAVAAGSTGVVALGFVPLALGIGTIIYRYARPSLYLVIATEHERRELRIAPRSFAAAIALAKQHGRRALPPARLR